MIKKIVFYLKLFLRTSLTCLSALKQFAQCKQFFKLWLPLQNSLCISMCPFVNYVLKNSCFAYKDNLKITPLKKVSCSKCESNFEKKWITRENCSYVYYSFLGIKKSCICYCIWVLFVVTFFKINFIFMFRHSSRWHFKEKKMIRCRHQL